MLAIRLVYFWCKSRLSTIKHNGTTGSFEYLKLIFLEIQIVTIRSVFVNLVTYYIVICFTLVGYFTPGDITAVYTYIYIYIYIYIKTHDSELRGQEEAAVRDE